MKVYTPEPHPKHNLFTSFLFKFAPEAKAGGLFKDNLPPNFFETDVEYVADPAQAEAVILANNFVHTNEDTQSYIKKYADTAEQHRIPIYIFSCGDLTDALVFDPRVLVFKYSIYRYAAEPNEICAPTLTEDLGEKGVSIRPKRDKPIVSFCGKAGFATPREWLGTLLRRIRYEIKGMVSPAERARIRGVYWRIWAIRACKRSKLVDTLFVLRKTFSGAVKTIEVPPEQARKEFVDSVVESDFVLAPKGDGNYSNRFLEALSLGRIPVVIDTEAVFPFEDRIPYEKIVVRVPMSQVRELPRVVCEFYDALSEDEWRERQQLARQVFQTYLRQDQFFRTYFSLRQTQK